MFSFSVTLLKNDTELVVLCMDEWYSVVRSENGRDVSSISTVSSKAVQSTLKNPKYPFFSPKMLNSIYVCMHLCCILSAVGITDIRSSFKSFLYSVTVMLLNNFACYCSLFVV